jgi:glycosyltransferase involved in cell wall biosynthesis
MNKKSIAIYWEVLTEYRIPILEKLSEHFDIYVFLTSTNNSNHSKCFKLIPVRSYKALGFTFRFSPLLNSFKYDALIFEANLRRFDLLLLLLTPLRNKIVVWGIGVSGSYEKPFNISDRLQKWRNYFFSRSASLIFYSVYPLAIYLEYGVASSKLFVAHNTVCVPEVLHRRLNLKEKNRFCFVGTLHRQKGLEQLLSIYKFCSDQLPAIDIVGDGVLFEDIREFISDNSLSSKVYLHGRLSIGSGLETVLSRCSLNISPLQAGLSIQTCAAFGVPSIVTRSALTGGEIQDIEFNDCGFFVDNLDELESKLILFAQDQTLLYKKCVSSYNFYWKSRTGNEAVRTIKDAIDNIK